MKGRWRVLLLSDLMVGWAAENSSVFFLSLLRRRCYPPVLRARNNECGLAVRKIETFLTKNTLNSEIACFIMRWNWMTRYQNQTIDFRKCAKNSLIIITRHILQEESASAIPCPWVPPHVDALNLNCADREHWYTRTHTNSNFRCSNFFFNSRQLTGTRRIHVQNKWLAKLSSAP